MRGLKGTQGRPKVHQRLTKGPPSINQRLKGLPKAHNKPSESTPKPDQKRVQRFTKDLPQVDQRPIKDPPRRSRGTPKSTKGEPNAYQRLQKLTKNHKHSWALRFPEIEYIAYSYP